MFEEQLAWLSDEQLEALRRESELGELNFTEVVKRLRVIREIAQALEQEDPLELRSTLLDEAGNQLRGLEPLLEQMRSFTLAQDQAASQHGSIASQIEQVRDWFAREVRPNLRGADVDSSAAKTAVQEAENSATRIREMLARLRAEAGEAGAGKLSAFYSNQGKGHAGQARWFLIGTGVSVGVIVLVGLWLFVWNPLPVGADNGQWQEFLRGLVERLFFLGVVAWVLAFLSRNYRVTKHLQIVNEQKSNALDTYPLFIEAAPTPDTQNIITAELAKGVLNAGDTGFLSLKEERSIIENQPSLLTAIRPVS
jgi:hypothetical protein